MREAMRGLLLMGGASWALLIASSALPSFPAGASAHRPDGSMSPDSLAFPGEVRVITKEDLRDYNVHTLGDILELLHDVSFWREGPPGSRTAYSIDGRSSLGVTLLVNGEPFYDPYNFEALSRFLPISRLERVEIIYSGSPYYTGDLSAGGAINFVIEEGGRPGPTTSLDFTYGSTNKRARRVWFSTPQAHVNATIAYDEYLQDAAGALTGGQTWAIGDYNSRTVLMDLLFSTAGGNRFLVRLQRYEDTYVGTRISPREDIRYAGFMSLMRYERGGLRVSLKQQAAEVKRTPALHDGLVVGGAVDWSGNLGNLSARIFAKGEHSVFENAAGGVSFDPEYDRVEGGCTAWGGAPAGFRWRGGIYAGSHSVVGTYAAGELGLMRSGAVTPGLSLSRRVRVPSVQELFLPPTDLSWLAVESIVAGNDGLGPEITDEVSVGGAFHRRLWVHLFARRERSRIIPAGPPDSLAYRSEGAAEVTGGETRFVFGSRYLGFDYDFDLGFELLGKRSEWTPGIPRYRFVGRFHLSRRVFSESEVVTVRWDSEASGSREWYGAELDAYSAHNVAISMTLMGAVLKFQLRNAFDAEYETAPGFLMPQRHWVIGVFWELFD